MRKSWVVTADFETRSRLNLKKVGAWTYSRHSSTVALCMSYAIDNRPARLWKPGQPFPRDLRRALERGARLEAHNTFFEYCIWNNVCARLYGFPHLDIDRFECTAAKAAYACLPRSLDGAARAKGLDVQKGDSKAMLKLSRPRKPSKNNPSEWVDDPELFKQLYKYCRQDTVVERELSYQLPALSPMERSIFRADLRVNARGMKVDMAFVRAALKVASRVSRYNTERLYELTGGEVDSPTQTKRFLKFCHGVGLNIPNTKKDTIEETLLALPEDAPELHRELLTLRQEGSRSSLSKYKSFLACTDPTDEKVYGLLLYFGANATGRWSGRLVQPQNFPRGGAKGRKDEDPGLAMERMVLAIKATAKDGNLKRLTQFHKSPAEVLSTALRGAFIPSRKGWIIGAGDYSAIEARCLFWLAQDPVGLKVYHDNKDIYRDMGSVIFNKPPEDLDTGFERMMGKTTVLGCGYGMAAPKFQLTCKKSYGVHIPMELAERCVRNFRRRYAMVPRLWYGLGDAAKDTLKTGRRNKVGLLETYIDRSGDLRLLMPSGRALRYRKARLSGTQIVFTNGKGFTESTYGGKLVENACQALARDLLADALVKAEFHDDEVNVLFTSHDEVVAEGEPGKVAKRLVKIMENTPKWAKTLPIKVEAWESARYHK